MWHIVKQRVCLTVIFFRWAFHLYPNLMIWLFYLSKLIDTYTPDLTIMIIVVNCSLGTYYVPCAVCKHIRYMISFDPQTILLVSIMTNTFTMRKKRRMCLYNLLSHTTSNQWWWDSKPRLFHRDPQVTAWLPSTNRRCTFSIQFCSWIIEFFRWFC